MEAFCRKVNKKAGLLFNEFSGKIVSNFIYYQCWKNYFGESSMHCPIKLTGWGIFALPNRKNCNILVFEHFFHDDDFGSDLESKKVWSSAQTRTSLRKSFFEQHCWEQREISQPTELNQSADFAPKSIFRFHFCVLFVFLFWNIWPK